MVKNGVRKLCLLLSLLLVPVLVWAGTGGPYGGVDHTRKISQYNGPSTCLGCHSTSKMGTNLAEDVYNSAHFQFRTPSPFIDMPGGGSHGMVDRACGLPGTTLMANNYAYTILSPDGSKSLDDGCGKCHIAYKPPYQYTSFTSAMNDIDCLRCHAAVYGPEWDVPVNLAAYGINPEPHARKVVDAADGSKTWSQDRSLRTAQSVGNLPKSEFCLRCHEHGYTGYKRSTPFTPETDAHAARNVECYQCHVMERHRIARGNFVTDGVANDLPTREVTCASTACHTSAPHNAANAAALNNHLANVSCEACHITQMDMPENIRRRAWAPFTLDPVTGQWQSTPTGTAGEYPGFFDAYNEYFPAGTWPTLRWFDGKASMLAQASAGYGNRKSEGGCAKLFAFKPFVSGMLFDAAWLPGPSSDPAFDAVNGTWPFSMKDFYEKNWTAFRNAVFVDSVYATARDYWNARPDMAVMMNNFPMMLQFDRAIFLTEAGNVTGTPVPGPQSAATYPGLVKAINSGMGKMAVDMGYFPVGSDLVTVGQYLWSGTFFGMWVPIDMNPESPFFTELGSLITMSHSIKGAAQMGEPCYTCHMTPEEYGGEAIATVKRIDFGRLGYPDKDANSRIDPKYGDIEQKVVKAAVGKVTMALTVGSKGDKLTATVTTVNAATGAILPNVKVNGVLSGPAGDAGLPLAVSGTSSSKGTITFTYTRKPILPGTYLFTVQTLTYNGQVSTVNCTTQFTR